jgi:hypothetical protein
MKSATILTIAVFVCVATAAVGQEAGIRPQVPIVIKHSAEGYDPCKYGVVHNLDPKGDGFLAVKAGPGLHYERIDKLNNGKQVFICGDKGKWYAIVYTKTRQGDRAMRYCNVEENWPKTLPYTGPCRSGWAHQRWIKQISG